MLRGWMVAVTLSAGPVVAAGAPPAQTPLAVTSKQPAQDQELGEVLVEGRRTREKGKRPGFKDLQEPFDFLARLVGEFVIDGNVDLHAAGNKEDMRKVSGRIECLGFGVAPGVLCELKVRWPETRGRDGEDIPGGVSTLNPAVMLFGFEPAPESLSLMGIVGLPGLAAKPPEPGFPGVSYVVLDSNGIAETATGEMITSNTVQSRSKCMTIPGNCERLTQITALPDLKTVEMKIDLEIDGKKAVRFAFVMHRIPGKDSVIYGRKPGKKK